MRVGWHAMVVQRIRISTGSPTLWRNRNNMSRSGLCMVKMLVYWVVFDDINIYGSAYYYWFQLTYRLVILHKSHNNNYTVITHACIYHPVAVDGGWSDFSACSPNCGDGTQTRTCTNPAPAFGGEGCVGVTSKACNLKSCPPTGYHWNFDDCTNLVNVRRYWRIKGVDTDSRVKCVQGAGVDGTGGLQFSAGKRENVITVEGFKTKINKDGFTLSTRFKQTKGGQLLGLGTLISNEHFYMATASGSWWYVSNT